MRTSSKHSSIVYWSVVCALLSAGVALRAPALHANLYADDWDHYAIEKGIYPVQLPAWDMFRWVGNGDAERQALLHAGRLPWWSSPELKLSVLRPLASVLAHFDYGALDGVHHPARLHIHTVLWWCFLLLGVAALMHQLLPLPVALLTTALYALDDCFIMPYAWIANRSEIIALAFVVWAVVFQVRAQQSGSARMRWLVAGCVLLAFCAGEHALAALAYLLSASLAGPGTLRERVRSLVPACAIVLVYVLVRAALGYGVAGSGFYIDPLGEPLRYLQACLTRLPILLSELLFSIPCEWSYGAPLPQTPLLRKLLTLVSSDVLGSSPDFVGVGIAAALISIGCSVWLRRRGERALLWLVAGALLSLLPLGGTIASGRLTVAPAIGFSALLAYLLWTTLTAGIRYLPLAAIIVSLALAWPIRRSYDGAHYVNGMSNRERAWIEGADFGVASLAGRHVFVLAAQDLASETSIPFIVHAAGRARPESATLLSPRGDSAQTLVRVADNAFELALGPPSQPPKFNGSVYRASAELLHAGDTFPSPRFQVTVIETAAGEPHVLRFDFPGSLDDDSSLFMVGGQARLTRFHMPKLGERVVIPAAQIP